MNGPYAVVEIPGLAGWLACADGYLCTHRGTWTRGTWRGREGHKYLSVSVPRDGGGQWTRTVHALMLTAFYGSRPIGHQGRHLDDDRANNRLENLRYGTPRQNADDARRNGCRRESKLTSETVRNLRAAYAAGVPQRSLAVQYGVSQSMISLVVLEKSWAVPQ